MAELEREREFLQQQLDHARQKITRLESLVTDCGDCAEQAGLKNMLSAAQFERDTLQHLLDHQSGEQTISLETLVMDHARTLKRQSEALAREWKRGKPTPPAYWEMENKLSFLSTVLNHYHAWQDGRAYYEPSSDDPQAQHPWFVPFESSDLDKHGSNSTDDLMDALYEAIKIALADQPADHLDIIVETPHQVIITGYAHSAEKRDHIISTIRQIDGVREMVLDLKVAEAEHCPICTAAS